MKHTSIKLDTPIEFINIVPFNPLISKCQIKVCYVSDEPNRNKSVITKEVAKQIANSLPGSPIVGHFNDNAEDFEEHNRLIKISNGKFEITDDTRPYGFVDLSAKVWFQEFLDDDQFVREYLMTEGWIWTGQYPEAKRVIEDGNNQSMELDEGTIQLTWAKDENGKPKFFIINEAIISKLCVLGEEYEPCFEGATITQPIIQFSLGDSFKEEMLSMMNELKELLKEGGEKVFTTYAVEIGDQLWSALWSYVEKTYPDPEREYCSVYSIDGVFEENGQKFVILRNRADMKYYRLNFSLSEEEGFVPSETLVEVTKTYTPAEEPQFAPDAVTEFETSYALEQKNSSEEGNSDETNQNNSDDNTESNEEVPAQEEPAAPAIEEPEVPVTEDTDPAPQAEIQYSLEEIPEYVELLNKYSALEEQYNALVTTNQNLESQVATLGQFKLQVERKEKENMINSFYMLSDEDKADVINNIDQYSLDDIEAKLSIICVRNKVKFVDEEENNNQPTTVFKLEADEDVSVPAWVKRAMAVAKTM